MSSIQSAMRRSLAVGRSPAAFGAFVRTRDVVTDVQRDTSAFTHAFSSWDNCMSVAYCKWPAIGLIIVGGIIVLSIFLCITRRLCCGLSCCCECFECLRCCGDCMGCCDPPRRRRQYLDDSYIPTGSRDGYQPPAPMTVPAPSSRSSYPVQYAHFDAKSADNLPAMPSWDTSTSVYVEEEPVELEQLQKPRAPSPDAPPISSANRAIPSSAGRPAGSGYDDPNTSSPSRSPIHPDFPPRSNDRYADPYANPHASPYPEPYASPNPYTYPYVDSHRGPNQDPNQGYVAFSPGAAPVASRDTRSSLRPSSSRSYSSPNPYRGAYAPTEPLPRIDPALAYGYDPTGPDGYAGAYGVPAGRAPPDLQRQYTSDSYRPLTGTRDAPPSRDRGYGSPIISNAAGFDFTSGYSRPQTPRSQVSAPDTGVVRYG